MYIPWYGRHAGYVHPVVWEACWVCTPPGIYTRVCLPGILHPPGYTTVHSYQARQRVYIPVLSAVRDDDALGSRLRIVRS